MMETPHRTKVLLEHLEWNIQHLQEILKNKKTVYYRDASIQRFGFTFALALKSIRAFLETFDKTAQNPEQYFDLANEMNWFEGISYSKEVVEDYLKIKDGFTSQIAESVYSKLEDYRLFFITLHGNLSKIEINEDSIQA